MSNLEPSQLIRLYWFGIGAGLLVLSLTSGITLLLLARQRRAARHEMTLEEIAAAKAARAQLLEDRRFFRAVLAEARFLLREIPHHLAIQNSFETYYTQGPVSNRARHTRGGQKRRPRRVQFEAVLITRTEIWFRVDGRKLPSGTSFFDLKNPNNHVMENLQYGIGRACRYAEDNFFNLFIRIGLKNSLMGIPKMVMWRNVVDELPKTISFAVPVGVNEYNKLVYQDVTKWPHGLILGGTGGGKSTGLKQILITLITRNSPARLKLYLVDLKRTELPSFAAVPHVIKFINRVHDVQPALTELHQEMERRLSMFEGTCNDIQGWNKQTPQRRLHRILFVVDELAILTRNKKYRDDALQEILELVALGRAVGIHLLLCTQTVTKEVLSTDILANVDGRICYSVRNMAASILAVGNGAAVGLQPPGRCVLVDGLRDMYLQTPLATDEDIEQAINYAIETYSEPDPIENPLQFLCRIGLENYGGWMRYRALHTDHENQTHESKISQKRICDLLLHAEYNPDDPERSVIEIPQHGRFVLAPGKVIHNNQPRLLVPINGTVPSDIADIVNYVQERWDDLGEPQDEPQDFELDNETDDYF